MTTPSKDKLIEEANKDGTISPNRVTVLYADYGKRKTTTACSMVQNHGLLLSSDDSWKVLLNDRHKDIYSKIKVTNLEGLSQFDYIDFNGYDTIIWDTVSQSVDEFLDILSAEAKWTGTQLRQKITSNNPIIKNLEALAPMDYRVTRDFFRPVLNKLFKETNAHIIFTSQFKEPMAGLSKDTQTRPDIPAATFKIIGTRADIIGYIKPANRGIFEIDMTENSMTSLGKSRIEGLQGKMNLDVFVNKYKEIVFK